MRRLVLVRHAAVEPVDGVPPDRWVLTQEGRAAAARLAGWHGFRDVGLLASSPEPKALGTAAPIAHAAGLEARVEPDLREVERPAQRVLDRGDFVALTGAYLAGEPVEGWEPAADARRRVTDSVERLLAAASGDVAVVSHGLVLGLFLGSTVAEWERIELPAVAVLDAGTRTPVRPWSGVDELLGP
jgi:broad specificity phosphatase PhoE